MKALGSRLRRSIRVLSPKIEPPERVDDGSTAKTATRLPCPVSICPKLSIKVDLPTPGVPDSPMRSADRSVPNAANNWAAAVRSWGRVDSTNVIARAKARRSPDRMCSAVFAMSICNICGANVVSVQFEFLCQMSAERLTCPTALGETV